MDSIQSVNIETLNDEKNSEERIEKPKVLYLKFDNTDLELKNKVISILENYKGESECRILCSSQKQVFKFDGTVEVNNLLLYELATILPENDIKFV